MFKSPIPKSRTCQETNTQKQFCVCLEEKKGNLATGIKHRIQDLVFDWLVKTGLAEGCEKQRMTVESLKFYSSNELVRHNVRHFTNASVQALKRPSIQETNFISALIKFELSCRIVNVKALIQHQLKFDIFKILSTPKVQIL